MSKWKWSNCILECIKTFIKNPFTTRIYKKGSWRLITRKQKFPHFYWYDKKRNKFFHFCGYEDDPCLYIIHKGFAFLYVGRIEEVDFKWR